MTTLNFTKMQAAGNDFIMINNQHRSIDKEKLIAMTPKLCDRHFGIGADGLIALQPANTDDVDYTMLYRNADGSDAGMCGNGARCMARFAAQNGFSKQQAFNVHSQIYRAEMTDHNQVTVHFPMMVQIKTIDVGETTVRQLNTGTEHIVLEVTDAMLSNRDQLIERGRELRHDPIFNPTGTNVNFMCRRSVDTLFLRTYEKGVESLTKACGTGAIAAALAHHQPQQISSVDRCSTTVQTDGGNLQVGFFYDEDQAQYEDITLSGEASFVFKGQFEL